MNSSRILVALSATTLLLSGCAASAGALPADPASDPTQTSAPPETAALVVSLEGVTAVDADGETLETDRFDDGQAVLSLLGTTLGSTPEPEKNPDNDLAVYSWGDDLTLWVVGSDFARVRVNAAEVDGVPIRTEDGIQVGSSRDDLLALDVYDPKQDFDGDGYSDFYGLEAAENPDHESLADAGQPGTDYVQVELDGTEVAWILSPSNDYTDL
jgi:hypothetical protein